MPAATTPPAPSAGTAPDRGFAARESAARIRLLFERTQASMWFSAPAALMVAVLLWTLVPQPLLLGWLGIKFAIFGLRVAVWWKRLHGWDDARWLRAFTVAVTLDGLAWSLLGTWLAPPADSAVTALLIATLIAAASIGAMVLSLHPPALYGFTGTMLLPAALWHGLGGTPLSWYVALGLGLFALFVLVEGRAMTRHLREMLRLRLLLEDEAQARADALVLAERHSAVKSQFLANMSHEMRTPLHGILGLTRQLRVADASPAARERHIELIERSGEHLLGLINDALDFAKLEAGHARLVDEPFDLVALVEDVVALSGGGARDKGLLLDVSTAGLGRPGGWMRGDAARVRQILHNLVGNAVKFTDAGRVAVRALREGSTGMLRIEVEDSGVGIDEAQLERVFDAFHQAEGAFDRRYTGTGLGLTIARELARAMGGDLKARSRVGEGSVFVFRAPLPPALPDTVPPEGSATRPDTLPVPLAGRVLVAEDNPVNALVVEAMLRQAGVDVVSVDDGARAVDAWERCAPDLVLMDLQMPVMDGLAATRAIRERETRSGRARTPIVALTANAFDSDRDDCLAAGMDAHLAKPFRDDELKALLRLYLGEVGADAARPVDVGL